jgi:hypothetical protein
MRTLTAYPTLMAALTLAVPLTVGCSQDPATTVTLEITGISAESDREKVAETLKEMTDGSSHSMRSTYSGDQLTISVSPVSDVDAFAEKIDFGEVTSVNGRTIQVTYGP